MDEQNKIEEIVNDNYKLRSQLEEQKKLTTFARDEVYRLRSDLKKLREEIRTGEVYQSLKNQVESEKEKVNYLRSEICRLKQNRPTEKQREIHERLREENETLKSDNKLYKHFKSQVLSLQRENEILKEALKTLTTKNKKVFYKYFDKLQVQEDGVRISFATVLLDFEFMFIFQKLFEMHVFDYIVDRQDPDNKTDADTKQLIRVCKIWTDEIIKNTMCQLSFNPAKFKQAFKLFTREYVEKNIKKIAEEREEIDEISV